MKNNNVKIVVYEQSNKFYNFLIYNKIYYDYLIRNKNYYILTIDYKDIYKFEKYNYKVLRYYGIKGIKNFIDYNKLQLFGLLFSLVILYLLSNTIFNIEINTDNKDLESKIIFSLNNNNIKKYKHKKTFEEIQKIKEKILEENKDIIEWIEITEDGCNYIVEVTEKIIGHSESINNIPTNIVASSDGLIKHVDLISGVKLKDINDYVKKGDIIITGNIYKGETLINQVPSIGKIYAEVWYTVKTVVPFKYIDYVETGKIIKRYYIKVFSKEFTIIGKYNTNNSMNIKELIIDKPYLPFDVYKEIKKEYKYKTFIKTENQAYEEALLRSDTNIKNTFSSDEYIIYKNTLKKQVFSSKIEVEIFYKVYKNVTSISPIEEVINDQ